MAFIVSGHDEEPDMRQKIGRDAGGQAVAPFVQDKVVLGHDAQVLLTTEGPKIPDGQHTDVGGVIPLEGQGDLDEGLGDFADDAYDYVILNQTLQVVKHPQIVLREMMRIGRYGIVGFPNFGHWSLRAGLFFGGRAPKSPALPFEWYNTPNIRVLTIRDFRAFCREENLKIVSEHYLILNKWRRHLPARLSANLLAHIGLFVVARH